MGSWLCKIYDMLIWVSISSGSVESPRAACLRISLRYLLFPTTSHVPDFLSRSFCRGLALSWIAPRWSKRIEKRSVKNSLPFIPYSSIIVSHTLSKPVVIRVRIIVLSNTSMVLERTRAVSSPAPYVAQKRFYFRRTFRQPEVLFIVCELMWMFTTKV